MNFSPWEDNRALTKACADNLHNYGDDIPMRPCHTAHSKIEAELRRTLHPETQVGHEESRTTGYW